MQSQTAKTLFHLGGASIGSAVPAFTAVVAPAAAIAKTVQITNRLIRSPVLRRHYVDVLTQAAAGNAAATQKSLKKFDIIAQREEKKEQKKQKGLKVKFNLEDEEQLNQ